MAPGSIDMQVVAPSALVRACRLPIQLLALHGDFEGGADLSHPRVAQPSDARHEHAQRHALDRVEVDGASTTDRVLARLEDHLAGQAANRGRTRGNERSPKPRYRGVARSTTTGRRPISGGSHHQTSPRIGMAVMLRRPPGGTTRDRPIRRARPADGRHRQRRTQHRLPRRDAGPRER